jgi:twinkle protein
MFVGQMALDLCCQRRRVLVVSLEMLPVDTMVRITLQSTGLAQPTGHQVDDFHAWTDDRLWLFDHVGRLDPEQTLALCRYFVEHHDGSDVVIDSLTMVCGSEDTMDEQKQFVTDLCRVAQETGLHVHLLAHCRKPSNGGDESKPPSKYDIRGTSTISDQASNVVLLWFNEAKAQKVAAGFADEETLAKPDFLMICAKQRNGVWQGALKFWFDHGSLRFLENRGSPVEPYRLENR